MNDERLETNLQGDGADAALDGGAGAFASSDERGAVPDADPDAAPGDALAALQAENAALNDKYLRLFAEFENYRKRSAREWRDLQARAGSEVLQEMLELGDNLERALAAPGEDAASLRKGVGLIAQQLQAKLKRFGVEPIAARGEPFDPTRHEAVLLVDADGVESQRVVEEVQRGYLRNGEVLRPARVTVAK